MNGRLVAAPAEASVAAMLAAAPGPDLRILWLGQAGFVIDGAGRRLVIDPYLSDSLAEKYRGTPRPHERMMAAPVTPDACRGVDLVLCTHAHTDHMDPGTLPALMAANPNARLVAPRAAARLALERAGIAPDRLIPVEAGETIAPFEGIAITATRAAHETVERDEAGDHRFLGHAVTLAGVRLWHSGDCVPFEGLEQDVAALRPDIALLPVNGRRPELSQNGVPGNFELNEALDLSRAIGAEALIAHHYGMFAFNTADPATIDRAGAASTAPAVHRARTDRVLHWQPG